MEPNRRRTQRMRAALATIGTDGKRVDAYPAAGLLLEPDAVMRLPTNFRGCQTRSTAGSLLDDFILIVYKTQGKLRINFPRVALRCR
jgi:hypothetical protein